MTMRSKSTLLASITALAFSVGTFAMQQGHDACPSTNAAAQTQCGFQGVQAGQSWTEMKSKYAVREQHSSLQQMTIKKMSVKSAQGIPAQWQDDNWQNVDVQHSKLRDVVLHRLNVNNGQINASPWKNVNSFQGEFKDTTFTGNYVNADFETARFYNSQFQNAILNQHDHQHCNFDDAKFNGGGFSNTSLGNTRFRNTHLKNFSVMCQDPNAKNLKGAQIYNGRVYQRVKHNRLRDLVDAINRCPAGESLNLTAWAKNYHWPRISKK